MKNKGEEKGKVERYEVQLLIHLTITAQTGTNTPHAQI